MSRESAILWLATQTYGRCPANNVDLNLPVSRQCPLGVELAAMIDAPSAVSFSCPQYRNTECSCPIEDEKIDLFLQIAEANP